MNIFFHDLNKLRLRINVMKVLKLPNGINIQEGLSRMFSNPISCINNRFLAVLGSPAHSSRYGMTQHYYICITGQYLNIILNFN